MSYSKVKKLRIKNFRSIGNAEISFEQSPVVALVGGNESGKTSVIKAFSVCSINSNERKQKDYIKTGKNSFNIQIELEDGTIVERAKSSDFNKICILKNGESIWETHKIDKDKSDSSIKELDSIMGLMVEPETKECLHIRTYENRLLFVNTPGSANYKVVYDALKVDNLVKAVTKGNQELNQLKNQLSLEKNAIDVLEGELKALVYYNIETLLKVRDRLKKEQEILSKLKELSIQKDNLEDIKNKERVYSDLSGLRYINTQEFSRYKMLGKSLRKCEFTKKRLGLYVSLDTLGLIDINLIEKVRRLQELEQLKNMYNKQIKLAISVKGLESLNESIVRDYNSIIKYIDRYTELNIRSKKFNDLKKLKNIDTVVIQNINQLRKVLHRLDDVDSKLSNLDKEIVYLGSQLKELEETTGLKIIKCSNCGEVIIVE